MKKLILSEGTEFEQNGKDLVIIETNDRAGIPVMLGSEEFNEAYENGESEAKALINAGGGSGPELITANVTPSTEAQTLLPESGKAYNKIEVSAVDATIDANIVAENIKNGVTILGVEGTYEGGSSSNYHTLTINANGGTNRGFSSLHLEENENMNLEPIATSIMPPMNKVLAGFSTNSEGPVEYELPGNYTMGDSDETLYAIYTTTYSIVLNGNGGTINNMPSISLIGREGSTIDLSLQNVVAPTGKTFVTYTTTQDDESTAVADITAYEVTGAATLYAYYTEDQHDND